MGWRVEAGGIERALRETISDTSWSPGVARMKMRRIMAEHPEEAAAAVFRIAEGEGEVCAFGPIASALSSSGEGVAAIAEPLRTDLRVAVTAAMALSCVDASFEVKLVRQIERAGARRRAAVTQRVLDVLGSTHHAHRAMPLLLPLTYDPDPLTRSRATLIVGRWKRDPRWLAPFLDDSDPRVRANAVESLWGARGASRIYAAARRDFHHRVVANALVGMHRVGAGDLEKSIEGLIVNPDPNFQAAGVWAAAECGIVSFAELLQEIARVAGPGRGAAIRALVKLRGRQRTE